MSLNNKFYDKVYFDFKNCTEFGSQLDNRVVNGNVFKCNESFLADVGLKYLVELNKLKVYEDLFSFKIVKLDSIFNDFSINYIRLKADINRKSNLFFMNVAFKNKCFLPGKIFNHSRNGFSVGICGFVGFLPYKHSILKKYNLKSIFIITNFDPIKKIFTISQKHVNKIVSRTLFKLSSRIVHALKSKFGKNLKKI